MIRLLHIADIHIGTKFVSRKEEVRKILKKSVMKAFQNAIDFAIEERVDGVIIAGDLFDSGEIPFHGEAGFIAMMERLEDARIHVFYTSGNHDPYQGSTLYEKLKKYTYIHPFYNKVAETIDIISQSGQAYKVISAGHDGPAISDNIIKTFPIKSGHDIHIGIGHTMVSAVNGTVDHGNYMPCSLEDLKSKKYDYFALGHIHKAMELDEEGRIRYAGNIQGRHINETGEKGGWLIKLENGDIDSTFVPFHQVEWQEITVNLSANDDTTYALQERIKEGLFIHLSKGRQFIVRINLEGQTPLYNRIDDEAISELEEFVESLGPILDVTVKTRKLQPLVDREELKIGEHFLGAFLSDFDEDVTQFKTYLRDVTFISDKAKKDKKSFVDEILATLDDSLIQKIKKQV